MVYYSSTSTSILFSIKSRKSGKTWILDIELKVIDIKFSDMW